MDLLFLLRVWCVNFTKFSTCMNRCLQYTRELVELLAHNKERIIVGDEILEEYEIFTGVSCNCYLFIKSSLYE